MLAAIPKPILAELIDRLHSRGGDDFTLHTIFDHGEKETSVIIWQAT